MKNFRLFLALLAIVLAQQTYPLNSVELVFQACKKFSSNLDHALCNDQTNLPCETLAILNDHKEEMEALSAKFNEQGYRLSGLGVCQKSWLSGYFIKHGYERYENAHKLKKFIDDNNLYLIRVPAKYLYHVPDRSCWLSSNNYLVFSQEAEGVYTGWNALNTEQRKQLDMIIKKLPHKDLYTNFVVAKNGTITIIDTDHVAMPRCLGLKVMPDFYMF